MAAAQEMAASGALDQEGERAARRKGWQAARAILYRRPLAVEHDQ